MPPLSSLVLPLSDFGPKQVKLWASPEQYRAQTLSDPPVSNSIQGAKWWADTAAIQRLSRQKSYFNFIEKENWLPNYTTYSFFLYDVMGLPRLFPVDSPQFYATYGGFDAVVRTIREYKHVFEALGGVPCTEMRNIVDEEAAITSFPPGVNGINSQPVELSPNHIYFPYNKKIVALPIAQFIENFRPKTTDWDSMVAAAQEALSMPGMSAESRVGMARLALQIRPTYSGI